MSEEKRDRYYSFYSQLIANNLPQHAKIRRLKSSNGQELINGMAVHFEEISNTMDIGIRNLFLDLAYLDTPDIFYYTQLDANWALQHPVYRKNLLQNSSFEINSNARTLPDWWTCSPTNANISFTDGVVGDNALRIEAGTDETVLLTQTLDYTITAGQSVTLSCWYRINKQLTGTVSVPANYFGLHLIGTKRDGTQDSYLVNFSTDTAGKWRRLSFTYTPTRDIVKFDVTVSVLNSATFDWLDPVDVDCFQLERSSTATAWEPNITDQPFFTSIEAAYPAPVVFEHGTRAQYVSSLNDFWYQAFPTRIELEKSTYTSYGVPKTKVLGGLEVDFWNNRIPYDFHVHSNQIRKMGISEWGNDIFADYNLAFPNYEGKFDEDATITVLTVHFFHNRLWAIIQATNWKGTTGTYLAIIDPRVPHPEPDYLEVDTCIQIPSPPASIDRMFIRFEDQEHLLIGDATNLKLYRLYYDYFMIDTGRKIAIFRENYTNVVPAQTNPVKKELRYELRR